ncbi:MAG: response regulator [Deltaproteobacteria bacterium]|nr:response regulator [Deltaproteobacteria bacterium]
MSGNVSSVLEKSVATPTMVLEDIKNILGDIEVYPETHKLKETHKVKEKRETTNRILLVEDNESAIIQVKTVLENQGYAIDIARGGQEAIDYVKHTIPEGIVLDLMMPEIDGFEVLERIRSTKATAKIPVLILTAKDLTPDDFAKLSANNIQQLIQKGDIDQQGLLFKVQLMLGAEPKSQVKPLVLSEKKEEPEKPAEQQEKSVQPAIKKQIDTKGTRKAKPIQGRPTILVVEDNPDNMITIKAVLQNKYHILEALDGEEGLKTTLAEQPDLVLLDMALPKMDGMAVAKKIKEDKVCNEIPIIALTAHAMKGDREKIIAAGCDDYIPKPIDPEGILKKIEDWIKI